MVCFLVLGFDPRHPGLKRTGPELLIAMLHRASQGPKLNVSL